MWEIVQKLNDILPRQDKIRIVILFFMMLVAGILQLAGLGMILGFISILSEPNTILQNENLTPLLNLLNISEFSDLLLWGSIFLGLIFVIKSLYLVFYNYILSRFAHNKFRNIATELFTSYMLMPYHFHMLNNSATLIRNVTNETRMMLKWLLIPLLSIVMETVMITTVLIFLFLVEPVVTLVSALSVGLAGFAIIKFLKKYEQAYGKQAQQSRGEVIQHVSEGLGGIKEIKVLNRQKYFIEKLKTSLEVLKQAETYNEASKESFRPAIEVIAVLGMLTMALIMSFIGRSPDEIIATLTLFGIGAFQLLPSFAKITNQYSKLDYHGHTIIPIHQDLMNVSTELKQDFKNLSGQVMHLKKNIKLEKVGFTYPDDSKPILKDISISITKGSAIGLIGKSGAGKTTLVDLILGLYQPSTGKILVDDKNIQTNLTAWQSNIGYIPQNIYLSDDTVGGNIAFGLDRDDVKADQLHKAVEMAQLTEVINHLPQGLDTVIGENGLRLSGGQRQRIGIARALYNNPEVLIMDEATSALDNKTEQYIIEAIERLRGEKTIIIIAHRLSTVESCDQLFEITEGKISKSKK